jgi:hypothetical protein
MAWRGGRHTAGKREQMDEVALVVPMGKREQMREVAVVVPMPFLIPSRLHAGR